MKQLIINCPPEFNVGSKVYIIPTKYLGNKEITEYKILDFHCSELGCGCHLEIVKKQKGLEQFIRICFENFYKIAFPTKEQALTHQHEDKGE